MCLSSLPSTVSSLIFTALNQAAVAENNNYFIFTQQQVSSSSNKLSCHRKTHVSLSIFPSRSCRRVQTQTNPILGCQLWQIDVYLKFFVLSAAELTVMSFFVIKVITFITHHYHHISHSQSVCPSHYNQQGTELFRSQANLRHGAKVPIGPWTIRSVELSLPRTFALPL